MKRCISSVRISSRLSFFASIAAVLYACSMCNTFTAATGVKELERRSPRAHRLRRHLLGIEEYGIFSNPQVRPSTAPVVDGTVSILGKGGSSKNSKTRAPTGSGKGLASKTKSPGKSKGKGASKTKAPTIGKGLKTKAPTSKGKGKTKAPTPKGKGKTKSPKKGKGPKSSKSKKGKKSKKHTHPPTPFIPGQPTSSPSPTISIRLAPFQLQYSLIITSDFPDPDDVEQVVGLTQVHLNNIFRDQFSSLQSLDTISTGDRWISINVPYQIDYESTAVFRAGTPSSDIPSAIEMEIMLAASFQGDNNDSYIASLDALSDENVFSTTQNVGFSFIPNPGSLALEDGDGSTTNTEEPLEGNLTPDGEEPQNGPVADTSSGSSTALVASTVSVSAMFVVLVVALVYTRGAQNDERRKGLEADKLAPLGKGGRCSGRGTMTLAGETDAASTIFSDSEEQTYAVRELAPEDEFGTSGPSWGSSRTQGIATSHAYIEEESTGSGCDRSDDLTIGPSAGLSDAEDGVAMDSDDCSSDGEGAPVRVVDLIRLFTPSGGYDER